MGVFIGSYKNTSAARAGLKINHAVKRIINPAINAKYPKTSIEIKQTVGVDTSKLFIARTGIRGSNDLVWVGRAANYAAKLTALSAGYPTRITEAVFKRLADDVKCTDGKSMWEKRSWTDMGGMTIYRSTWLWAP